MAPWPQASLDYVLVPTVLASFILALISYFLVSPFLSNLFLPFYRKFDKGRQEYFNSLLFSTIHAIIIVAAATNVLFWLPWTTESLLKHDSPYGFFAMQFAGGYFMADFISILSSPYMRNDKFILLHHVTSFISVFFGCYFQGAWMPYVMMRLMAEFSTPFVNLRWILSAIQYPKTSPLFIFTGSALTFAFFTSRILPIPLFYYVLYSLAVGDLHPSATFTFPVTFKGLIICFVLLLDSLNLYWFSLLWRGLCKVLKSFWSHPKS